MTRAELIAIGRHKVRSDESLMLFYLKEFEILFGRKPNCASCTFVSDWVKFERGKNNENFIPMETKTFQLTQKGKDKIHTYKEGKQPLRTYGYKMTEAFANAYLTKGTDEQIEDRKKWFNVLPSKPKVSFIKIDDVEKAKFIDGVNLEDATGKQMNAYAKTNNIDFGDATRVADKREVIRKTL